MDGVEASLRLLRVGNFNRTIAKQAVAKQMATPAIHFLQGECILVRHSAATSIEQDLDIDTEAGSTLPQTSSPQHFLFCSFRHPASRGRPPEAPLYVCPAKHPKIGLKSPIFLASNPQSRTDPVTHHHRDIT